MNDAELNDALASREAEFINEYQHARPHLKNGLSKNGAGIAAQLLVNWFPKPFDAGFAERGIAYGEYQNDHKPTGYEWKVGDITFRVLGGEQIVMIFSEDGKLIRQSHIDQLIYNVNAGEIEIWDFKTSMGVKDEIDPDYYAQLTLYAYLLKRQLGLPYDITCRLQIASPNKWSEVQFQSWRAIYTVGQELFADIGTFEKYKALGYNAITKDEWKALIVKCSARWKEGWLYYGDDEVRPDGKTKKKTRFRVQCQRCDNWEKCVEKLGLPKNRDRLREDPDFFKGVRYGVVG